MTSNNPKKVDWFYKLAAQHTTSGARSGLADAISFHPSPFQQTPSYIDVEGEMLLILRLLPLTTIFPIERGAIKEKEKEMDKKRFHR